MKKYLLMLIAAGISISLVGCGSSKSDTNSKSSNSNTESSASSSNSNSNSKSSNSNTESSASSSNSNSNSNSDTKNSNTDSNKKVEHKVGEAIDIKGEELTVKTVTKDYKSGNQFLKPESGNQYVKIDVTIKNNTDDSIDVSSYEFKILDSNGVYHDTNYILNNSLSSTKVEKGGVLSGSISFEVPKNDNELKLVYTPSFWSDENVEIKL